MESYVLVAESRGAKGNARRRHREVIYTTNDVDKASRDAAELRTDSRRYYVMTYDQVRSIDPGALKQYEEITGMRSA